MNSHISNFSSNDGIIIVRFFKYQIFLFLFSEAQTSELCLALFRQSLKSKDMDHDGTHFDANRPHAFVILGASVSSSTTTVNYF